MKKICLNLLFLCFLASTSLLAQEKNDAYFNQVAEDICNCSTDLQALNDKAKLLLKEEKYDELRKLADEIDGVSAKFEQCITGLMLKYPEIEGNKEYERRAEEALKKHCPMFEEMASSVGEPNEIEASGEVAEIQEVPTVEQKYQDFASDVCDCLEQQPELKAKHEKLKTEGDEEKLATFRKSIHKNYPELTKCFNEMGHKHNKIIDASSSSAKTKKEAALRQYCPDYLNLLGL